MSKKNEFLMLWKKKIGTGHPTPEEYNKDKKFKEFAYVLNSYPELRTAFNEAVKEANITESDPASGLSQLFPLN